MRRRPPVSSIPDQNDLNRARWGIDRHKGFVVGKYLNSPPFFFTADLNPIHLVDQFRGRSVFLIAGGPSFAKLDHAQLQRPGIITMGLNNSPKTFRPDLWCCVDDPANFLRSIWLDPSIMKFVPDSHTEKTLFDSNKWEMTTERVRECPNVVYYRRNERCIPEQFLFEDKINWGNHSDVCMCGYQRKEVTMPDGKKKKESTCPKCGGHNTFGGRTVLLAAMRILFLLGFRTVYLLGCDLKMADGYAYHFSQDRHKGSINGNNSTYEKLKTWFKQLRPLFDKEDFHVFNCNPDSALKAFDHVPFETALSRCASELGGIDTATERTEGLYDRKANEKKKATPGPAPASIPTPVPEKINLAERRVLKQTDRKTWEPVKFKRLRVGDIFRMYEADGSPVVDLDTQVWKVVENPVKGPDGKWTLKKVKV